MSDRFEELRAIVKDELGKLLAGRPAPAEITDTTSLLTNGIIDSFDFIQLVMALEARSGATPDFHGMEPTVLASVDGLAMALLRSTETTKDSFTSNDLRAALTAVGIARGDHIFIYSALNLLGWPSDGLESSRDTILDLLGSEGTLVVPTPYYPFCEGKPFNSRTTPADRMGLFAELVRTSRGALRTPHPIGSIALIGRHAERVAAIDTVSTYEPGSAYALLAELGFKIVLLGAPPRQIGHAQFAEEAVKVPYRFFKNFEGSVDYGEGPRRATYVSHVRHLNPLANVDPTPVAERLRAEGRWNTAPLGYGQISSCLVADYVDCATTMLRADPYAFVVNDAEIRAAYPS